MNDQNETIFIGEPQRKGILVVIQSKKLEYYE